MLPVAMIMSNKLQINPSLFLFGLLIGASANIVACGLLKKEGYQVKFSDFMKIGIPFAFVVVTAAYPFVWFIWS